MPTRITITGPESTGKTTLAQQLATLLHGYLVTEYARTYLTPGSNYTLTDVETIGHAQHDRIISAPASYDYHIVDTDALTTLIWAEDKFQTAADQEVLWHAHLPAVYLLCYPDLPWQPDPLREDPTRRDDLYARYEEYLATVEVPVIVVKGIGDRRWETAWERLQDLLK